jgi:hypothetical protein
MSFEITVFWDVTAGTPLLDLAALDPEGLYYRQNLKSRTAWFSATCVPQGLLMV